MRDDLNRAAAASVLAVPGAAPQASFQPDALALGEVLAAELALAVPDADVNEVGAAVLRGPVDGEQEAGDVLLLAYLLELDVGGEVADEADDVHASTVDGHPSPVCADFVPEVVRHTACTEISGCPDLNWGPLRPERSALPGCATPRASTG